ncbi:MmgE/PrpD family protein [Streptomyces brasiliensis]|uniref:2-methylcitrate dehydratase n=1 Tax=Streptomyces brasiliensis TaxID=1954 RepID=A0A917L7H5_9ACTN|nr:MmgE/PrpD family protein [Streptomyces brasiliensis]GGJ50217.1 2-methylcitrate dehydratase [Streptomyces brasiliensis]
MTVEALSEWIVGLDYQDLPSEVSQQSIRIISDTLAVALGASREPEVPGTAEAARAIGGGGSATVLATGERANSYVAALLNGQASVTYELDEGNQWAINHPASHVLPAILATAEELGSSGKEFLVAFVVGYEAAARAGSALSLREGVHPFGTAMVVGAAAGVARLHGFSASQISEAVRVASAMTPASTQRAANMGATVRNLLTGLSSAAGVLGSIAVQGGVTGEKQALATVYGKILGENFDQFRLGDRLGQDWLILRNYFKLHACSRWNHAPIEAMSKLRARTGIKGDDIDRVIVFTYSPATRLNETAPPNEFAAKHSIPFNVAVQALLGHNGIEAYAPDVVRDPKVRSLMARIRVVEDPAYTKAQPAVRAARVEVHTRDGRCLIEVEDQAPGGFDNPYPPSVLDAKFDMLVTRGRSHELVQPLRDWLLALPGHPNLEGLSRLLRREGTLN